MVCKYFLPVFTFFHSLHGLFRERVFNFGKTHYVTSSFYVLCLWVKSKNLNSFERSFLKRVYLFIFRERGRKGGREGEKHLCVRETSLSCLSQAGNQGPGLQHWHVPCPDWELNPQPLSLQACTQYIEPHHPGLFLKIL